MKLDASAALSSDKVAVPRAALFSIGCDHYLYAGRLESAEADAKLIHDHLTSGDAGMYSAKESTLLLSPNKIKIENSLAHLLKTQKGLDVFTFYFAGHGTLVDGSFYLCPSNVELDAVSITAINIATVLRVICELRPRHAYVVVDACFSGGMALDLSAIIRSEVLAQTPEFGLSVLASSRMTKEALETSEGGLFTRRFAALLGGEPVVNRDTPYLGLGEIVRALPDEAQPALRHQAPNFWELNLTGPDAFCRNPAYEVSALSSVTSFGSIRTSVATAHIAPELATRVWLAYLDMPSFETEKLAELFAELAALPGDSSSGLSPGMEAVAENFIERAGGNEDSFAAAQIRGAVIRALLPLLEVRTGAREALRSQIAKLLSDIEKSCAELGDALKNDQYALLSRPGSPADLFYLPLRLAEVLGAIGLLLLTQDERPGDASALRSLSAQLLDLYGNSIVAVGEDQAPAFLLFLAGCKKLGWDDVAEEVIGRLYNDVCEHFGRILVNAPEPTEVIDYLMLRNENPVEKDALFLQRPSELLSVILIGAALFALDEAIDESLIELDHQGFAFFIPSSYRSFDQIRMDDGLSVVFQVGHNIWSLKDMRRIWREDVWPLVSAAMPTGDRETWNAALILSLLMPDRLPIFVLPEHPKTNPTTIRIG